MCLAMPGQLRQRFTADDGQAMGEVDYEGVRKFVNLSFVPEAQTNDYVIVHAGFAITILDQDEAQASLQAFRELQAVQTEELLTK
jgi:hydrogenase expression/formation protein HypC